MDTNIWNEICYHVNLAKEQWVPTRVQNIHPKPWVLTRFTVQGMFSVLWRRPQIPSGSDGLLSCFSFILVDVLKHLTKGKLSYSLRWFEWVPPPTSTSNPSLYCQLVLMISIVSFQPIGHYFRIIGRCGLTGGSMLLGAGLEVSKYVGHVDFYLLLPVCESKHVFSGVAPAFYLPPGCHAPHSDDDGLLSLWNCKSQINSPFYKLLW